MSELNLACEKVIQGVDKPASRQNLDLSADVNKLGVASPMQTAPLSEPLNPACFVCGEENPHGLHLAFQTDGHRASAAWTPQTGWESYKGIIHGGVISSVLDEAMSKAILSGGNEAFTADLRIRFRKKICVDDAAFVRGWVVSVEKRKVLAEASITSENGEERAHAWGVFLVVRHS
ncbi:MAG: PaaI family thioesterase [Terracidiphilus sp.]|nr:PaaI family thioesterase [Terracidiphilus sp.]